MSEYKNDYQNIYFFKYENKHKCDYLRYKIFYNSGKETCRSLTNDFKYICRMCRSNTYPYESEIGKHHLLKFEYTYWIAFTCSLTLNLVGSLTIFNDRILSNGPTWFLGIIMALDAGDGQEKFIS